MYKNKNKECMVCLSRLMLATPIGARIVTFDEFCNIYDYSRGTAQQSLHMLRNKEAIEIETHGRMGSILKRKDYKKLLKYSEMYNIVIGIPLPYSKSLAGIFVGLRQNLERETGASVYFKTMESPSKRIEALVQGQIDIALVLKEVAYAMIIDGYKIEVLDTIDVMREEEIIHRDLKLDHRTMVKEEMNHLLSKEDFLGDLKQYETVLVGSSNNESIQQLIKEIVCKEEIKITKKKIEEGFIPLLEY